MSNSEEAQHKKRKTETCTEACLPEDLTLNCLARLSRLELAVLSVVSKSYRSLVASADLYKTRSLMGRSESSVYVCLRSPPPDPKLGWYILRRRNDSSDLVLIPSCPCQAPEASSLVVLDWDIYVIGGLSEGKKHTWDVWLLDCRSHTWRRVPSMGVARANAAAGVVDGKIYVLGGCDVFEANKWGEVFDPKTQTWDTLPPMLSWTKHDQYIHSSVVRDQKVYAVNATDKTLYYSPSQGEWGRGNRGQKMGNRRDWCMIDNLIYCISVNGMLYWCDPDELDWREPESMMVTKDVKGLASLKSTLFGSRVVHFVQQIVDLWNQIKPRYDKSEWYQLKHLLPGARLINSGGNMVLFWDVVEGDHLVIRCAEISLERRQRGEIYGNIVRSNAVMTVDPFLDHYKVLYSVSVTL